MDINKKTQAIIPAAGIGARLKSATNKPFVLLAGKPIVVYSLEILEACSFIDSVIVVVHEQHINDFDKLAQEYKLTKVKHVVVGGQTRCQSVTNGLNALDPDTRYVLIHDGARPLISLELLTQSVSRCYEESAVIVGVPVKPTIKRVHPEKLFVEATFDRRVMWEIQTPQVFRKDIIFNTHKKNKDLSASDDSLLVERAGYKVKLVKGDYSNIKITTPDDLIVAQAFLGKEES
ncbi:MAG: 2-C-methyl-D-erythritol 4-phosphate cytidylyltransferase [Candidatus Omnitrophica bacterium]|nr:2-C-methyl-D-erythritol 4-phosphate cytidylyltransferase [Candidatus Omnitrophota bacterium]